MIILSVLLVCQVSAKAEILRLGFNIKDMTTLDPHFANDSRKRAIAEMVFNRLIRYKPGDETGTLEPDLAENIPREPEIADGRQVWTFKLRKGVMFHKGPETDPYEMTADDVVYSLQKAAEWVSPIYAGDYSGMTVEKAGDYSVKIILEKPMSPTLFIPRLAAYPGGFIVSKKALLAMRYEDFKTHPVGTGPFMIDKLTPKKSLRLRANKDYFRSRPLLRSIDIRFIPKLKTREAGLKAGRLHIIDGVSDTKWIRKMKRLADVTVDLQGIGEATMLHFNTSVKPMNDMRVRKAIAYALDRNEFLNCFGGHLLEKLYSPVPAQLTGGLKQEKVKELKLDYTADLEKAMSLLDKTEYADGFSLELVTSERPVYRKYYECLRDQLEEIGIDCDLNVLAHSSMHTRIRQGENPIVIYIAWRPDADAILTRFFHSDSVVLTGAKPDANFSHYDKTDKLINAARTEISTEEQNRLWKYAQIKVLDDMAAYPLHYIKPVHARRKYVDYGYDITRMTPYPYITEKTRIVK
ncbi:ABC transporter substrate-binding protein [Desulfonema magnum]|nr:ABC transporter substrate-binding protein [Desulfonema magnum]